MPFLYSFSISAATIMQLSVFYGETDGLAQLQGVTDVILCRLRFSEENGARPVQGLFLADCAHEKGCLRRCSGACKNFAHKNAHKGV